MSNEELPESLRRLMPDYEEQETENSQLEAIEKGENPDAWFLLKVVHNAMENEVEVSMINYGKGEKPIIIEQVITGEDFEKIYQIQRKKNSRIIY